MSPMRKGMPWTRNFFQIGSPSRLKDGRNAQVRCSAGFLASAEDRAKLDAEKKSLDEKNGQQRTAFATALKAMRSSAPLDERVEAGLNVLQTYPTDIEYDVKPRASVIRELIEIGKPAVPKLTAELDRAEKDNMLGHLAFVLCAIGDLARHRARIRAHSSHS